MGNVTLPVQMAPDVLNQPILPGWQFSLFSVDLGHSSDPEVEKSMIEELGSYGKQIGHIAEALEVVIERLNLLDADDLNEQQRDAIKVLLGDVAAARSVKHKSARPAERTTQCAT
jgi:hypothetical protein